MLLSCNNHFELFASFKKISNRFSQIERVELKEDSNELLEFEDEVLNDEKNINED